ncbi:L-type lectin-domain containing receptor kinase IX.1-like [Andrographis paniculata]|uniref:L-type lectin-domain containing receptor kinase IX.1-like n=1 Tax=Andrographis paniculata TaxID=175694 RepID=UPI0021E96227|nr:L-type lectin-domain containing receptor kinase IX.1-like [Andrographis paniculata]
MAAIHSWIILFFYLFLSPPPIISLSFNLPAIGPSDTNTNINTTGSYISSQGIQVTPDERGVNQAQKYGRAIYAKPLQLWDRATGNLTGFSSNFSFVIDSRGSNNFADGLAFFMAPVGTPLLPETAGGGIGYGTSKSVANSSAEIFLAVEFDTFPNSGWDPSYRHVGINIGSLRSAVAAEWPNNITHGAENNAWISYNAASMVLRVDFTSFTRNGSRIDRIEHIVDLRQHLPEHVIFGFSAATGALFQRNTVKSWNFSSTLDLPEPGRGPGPGPGPVIGTRKKTGMIVGLSLGLSAAVLVLVLTSYCIWKKSKSKSKSKLKNKNNDSGYEQDEEFIEMDNEFEKGSGPKRFSYLELCRATSNFSDEEKLGEGGFGEVFRGWLRETNSYIAVKRVSRKSKQGLKEYVSEVKIISQLRHRNLVQLIGWCHERGELLLVYEFMPNGSLDSHLFKGGESQLTWPARHKIALGLASALLYLHEEWESCVVHRDVKSSNIMLDSSFNTKLGDFGLARLVDHEKGSQTTILAGTMGYMAPECAITGKASKESDIYSFGVVLLEIACGRRTFEPRFPEGQMRLIDWVWSLYGFDKLLDVADPKLGLEFDAREIECLMIVGLWCAHPDKECRPSIRQAIHVLNFEGDLPELPPAMPVPRFYPSTARMADNVLNVGSDSENYSSYSRSTNAPTTTTSSSGSGTMLVKD